MTLADKIAAANAAAANDNLPFPGPGTGPNMTTAQALSSNSNPTNNNPNTAAGVARDPNLDYAYYDDLRGAESPIVGTKSLFNEYAVFCVQAIGGDFNKLYDVAGQDGMTPKISRNPSAAAIIKWSNEDTSILGQSTPYSFADFAYCKYYGHIPNNYMVTLRRFPIAMVDNLSTSDPTQPLPPIAQAVTFMGEEPGNKISEFMKQSLGLNWEVITAQIQDVEGNEKGYEDSLKLLGGAGTASTAKSALGAFIGYSNPKSYSGQAQAETNYQKGLYGSEGPYANKVYGPVNVIDNTYRRMRGLKHTNEISLKFEYVARSIGGVNPKAAMLDLVSNFLSLGYNNAKFWGGAIRYWPQHPNLPFFGDQKKFYDGDVDGYFTSVTKSMGAIGNSFMDGLKGLLNGGIKGLTDLASGIGQGLGKMTIGNAAAKSRPQILSFRSLLTGAPIGEWHLVVGNPLNPIAMIGNLIVTDMEIEFGDVLGADDFPTEVMFTVKLQHGRPRDKGDLESMLNQGNGRLYYGINGDVQSSSMNNSIIDTSGTKGNNNKGKTTDVSQGGKQVVAGQMAQKDTINSMWGGKFSAFSLSVGKKFSDPQS